MIYLATMCYTCAQIITTKYLLFNKCSLYI